MLPADVARCRGALSSAGLALKCATCARRHAWRKDHEQEVERMVVMEPPAKVSQCAEYISPRGPQP